MHTGVVRGGTALNVIPHECAFDFEFRHLPGDDPDRLLGELKDYIVTRLEPEMRLKHPGAGFTIEPLSDRGEGVGRETPFAIRPYRDVFGDGAPGVPRTISFRADGVPSGHVVLR